MEKSDLYDMYVKGTRNIQSLTKLDTIHVARKENDAVYVLGERKEGRKTKLYELVYGSDGKIIQEDSFILPVDSGKNGLMISSILGDGSGIVALCGGCTYHNVESIVAGAICLAAPLPWQIYHALRPVRERNKKAREFYRKVDEFKDANMLELRDNVKNINIYQESIGGAERELGPLELTETGTADRFITGSNPFWLRVAAYHFGADAIVDYQVGSSIGTPVRRKK